MTSMPRIVRVATDGPSSLVVDWKDGGSDAIELAGWIGANGPSLAPLNDAGVFGAPRIELYGSAVDWGPDGSDLAIDALHLSMLAAEQRPFEASDITRWQAQIGLSNHESAELLGVAPSTWSAYKAGSAKVPMQIAMLCRAVQRNPVLMHAHYRPRKAGRPKKSA